MATAKIITWSRKDKNGQFPIGIKVSQNGKPSYIFEGHSLPSRDLWDEKKQQIKKSYPHAARLTNYLTKKLLEVREKMLELDTQKQAKNAVVIKDIIKAEKNPKPVDTVKPALFQDTANQYLTEQIALGNRDVFIADTSRLKRFYEFTDHQPVAFSMITMELLRRFTIYLRSCKNRNNKKTEPKSLSERTVTNHLLLIRTLYNRAITAKLIDNKDYPFGGKGGIAIKFGRSVKIGLSEAEIRMVSELNLSGDLANLNDARNIWMLAYCFAGMRITDALLLKWSDFKNDRFYYVMSKNGEPGTLKVPDKAKVILDLYRNDQDKRHGLVFPFLKRLQSLDDRNKLRARVADATKLINSHMVKVMTLLNIEKSASTHKARHSFAQRAEDHKVSPKVLQKMYRHEDIKTTMIYQSNFSHEDADAALDAVIGNY